METLRNKKKCILKEKHLPMHCRNNHIPYLGQVVLMTPATLKKRVFKLYTRVFRDSWGAGGTLSRGTEGLNKTFSFVEEP